MRSQWIALFAVLVFLPACASTPSKIPIWETENIPRAYEVLGPVSVQVDVAEKPEEALQGIAGFITKDGRISDQVPSDMRKTLEIRGERYKEMIFDKLGAKAKQYGADAVIGTEYIYLPAYASFSTKATVSARGTMVKYK